MAVPQLASAGNAPTMKEMLGQQDRAGDLLINSPDDTHTPRTMADEDCLCLSVLSAPLHFNKGLTRLLNPLQQFFY